jgi:superfamily II DNA or RNA helicase
MSSSRTFRVNDNQERPISMALLREIDDFGFKTLELARPPSRFWGGRRQGGPVRNAVDVAQVAADPTFGDLLASVSESTMAQSRRAQAQLFTWFLLAEDPQRRLEVRAVSTLAHQASLVRHVLGEANLKSVLIADEVGLGKTVEAGLIIKELVDATPGLRVLYLAPAGLTRNVRRELDRLGLHFRLWVSGMENTARLTDQMVLASIHRAVHPAHYDAFVASGPWDVIVVDECHHLSDWQKDGGKPTRKFRLVDELRSRLSMDSRLILMSGTPHQGHPNRFENLLGLLQRGNESRAALAGRVIYRTKEDVRDWNDRPLFPKRDVRRPLVVDLGPEHREWLEEIHRTFEMNRSGEAGAIGQARRRALGWRCGQALQWATSSVEAGLGFLVRQAIRAGWNLETPALLAAVEALRPYRRGPADEDPAALYERIAREIGRQHEDDSDLEDIDEDDPDEEPQTTWRPDPTQLTRALVHGVALLRDQGSARWDLLRREILDPAGSDKVVLFAQPIETVTALAAYLQRVDGRRPAMIIGGQTPEERAAEVASFWRSDGPRFLVSSRAGGEGFNLQNSHVLVHVDVPWNPMELEQRVGRVHRFMSRRTIRVHTLVVKDSREVDMYEVARAKLRNITKTMGQERFEELFARVMALVAPEEIAEVLVRDALGPLSDEEQEALAKLVTEGHRRWERFDTEFSAAQRSIRAVAPGQATWDDLHRFAIDHLGARSVEGLSALRFGFDGDEVVEDSQAATVLEIDGALLACGDYASTPVISPDGRPVAQLGLNSELVCSALRRLGLPDPTPGIAYLRWTPLPDLDWLSAPCGVLVYARANIAIEENSYREGGLDLSMHVVFPGGSVREVSRAHHGIMIRAVMEATVRRDIDVAPQLADAIRAADERVFTALRRPNEINVRHAVFPVAAIVLG